MRPKIKLLGIRSIRFEEERDAECDPKNTVPTVNSLLRDKDGVLHQPEQ